MFSACYIYQIACGAAYFAAAHSLGLKLQIGGSIGHGAVIPWLNDDQREHFSRLGLVEHIGEPEAQRGGQCQTNRRPLPGRHDPPNVALTRRRGSPHSEAAAVGSMRQKFCHDVSRT
jgi:hypothetical protein